METPSVSGIIEDAARAVAAGFRSGEVVPSDGEACIAYAADHVAAHYPGAPPELCDFSVIVGAAIGRTVQKVAHERGEEEAS